MRREVLGDNESRHKNVAKKVQNRQYVNGEIILFEGVIDYNSRMKKIKMGSFWRHISFTTDRRRWVFATVLVAVLLVALLFALPIFEDTKVSTCVGTRQERSGVITLEPLVQRFVPMDTRLEYISVRYANCVGQDGTITFVVEDGNGKVLFEETLPISEFENDEYHRYDVDLTVKEEKAYYFKIIAEGVQLNNAPRVWLSNNLKDELRNVEYRGYDPNVRMQTNTELGFKQFRVVPFIVSAVSILVTAFTILLVLGLDEKLRRKACFVIMLTMPLVTFVLAEVLNGNSLTSKKIAAYFINYILYLIIYCLFFAITNKLRFTVLFSNTLIFVLAVVNYYKLEFRGEPLLITDIFSFSTAMNVASEYKIELTPMIIMAGCLFMAATAIVSRFRYSMHTRKTRLILGLFSAVLAFGMVTALFNTDRYSASANSIMKKLGIVNNVWNQPLNYTDNGMLVAITMNAQYLVVEPPAVYSEENFNNIVGQVEQSFGTSMITDKTLSEFLRTRNTSVNPSLKPNIICIMNESYTDFSSIAPLELNVDYSPFIDSLADSSHAITGECYVSTYGGGTANSEFEFLTGNTMLGVPNGSIPYQQYVSEENNGAGSLARILSNMGYETIALHPYLASGWNRPAVYEAMGFDAFYSQDDFENPEFVRSYISDECSYEMIIELYEEHCQMEQETGEQVPWFLFNVTMQNHGSYSKSYTNFEPTVEYLPDPGAYPQAEQYLTVANLSDAAIEELIEYFSNCGEPTVICFFGDHLPSLKDGFYEMLFDVEDTMQLEPEDMQRLYVTDYFVWANYNFVAPEIPHLSLNYLSTLVMQVADLPLTPYQMFLTDMYQHYPVITTFGIRDAQGNFYEDESMINQDLWNYYSVLQYNNLFGEELRNDAFFDFCYGDYLDIRLGNEVFADTLDDELDEDDVDESGEADIAGDLVYGEDGEGDELEDSAEDEAESSAVANTDAVTETIEG